MGKKIILICSNENEAATDQVCEWLLFFNKPFIRISKDDVIDIKRVVISNEKIDIEFFVKGQLLKLSDIKSYWYRRSLLSFKSFDPIESNINLELDLVMNESILYSEHVQLIKFFKHALYKKALMNIEEDNYLVKLNILTKAIELDLKVPKTLVTRFKKDLNFFKQKELINKAIGDIIVETPSHFYGLLTNKINKNEILYDEFNTSLFQELLEKKFELRIFYFNETFYSTAIFSQNNKNTEIDFRNYDREIPNRVIPYKLPVDIELKLKELMIYFNLKSGSIDMVYTKKEEYVFLEVNPVGQFEQVSVPGNYNLFKKIAEFL